TVRFARLVRPAPLKLVVLLAVTVTLLLPVRLVLRIKDPALTTRVDVPVVMVQPPVSVNAPVPVLVSVRPPEATVNAPFQIRSAPSTWTVEFPSAMPLENV